MQNILSIVIDHIILISTVTIVYIWDNAIDS